MNTLTAKDKKYIWHPYTQAQLAPDPIVVKSAAGAYLMTEQYGKLFDGISSWWVNAHGHCHPYINDALKRQSESLEHVMFANFTHEPGVMLAERLIEQTPANLARVFFSDNGSTAVETALKMAMQYWHNKGQHKTHIISLTHSYHGDTFGAMASSERSVFTKPFWPWLFHVLFTPSVCVSEHDEDADAVANALKHLETLLQQHHGQVAALIVEPMLQGAGGMRIFPRTFLADMAKLLKEHHVLLIADEVATGFYRTGKRFACEHDNVAPDIMCLAKSLTAGYLPLAATLATEEIYQAFLSDDISKALLHGHSFTANPLACSVSLASLDIFSWPETTERLNKIADSILRNLTHFKALPYVKNTRALGSVGVIELNDEGTGYLSKISKGLMELCLKQGLFIRPLGNVIYFMPPSCTTEQEVDWAFDVIYKALQTLMARTA